MARAARLARTLAHLRPEQVINRVQRRIIRPGVDLRPAPAPRPLHAPSAPGIEREPAFDGEEFRFLNQSGRVDRAADWNSPSHAKLWLYNLHYFDWLHQAAGVADRAVLAGTITRWIADNPPGKGNGWEPYPLSLRIVNWIKHALLGGALTPEALHSLAVQTRYLAGALEYHLLGNHLLANAKALFMAGCFFDGPEAEGWRRTGARLLRRELAEQVLPDGGHFELSTVYHCTITEDVLDLVNVAGAYGDGNAAGWRDLAEAMGAWLAAMTRSDGEVPLFNDGARGVAPSPASLMAYAERLGLAAPASAKPGLTLLKASGYFTWKGDGLEVFGDVGAIGPDYIPGHAHADTLSFELTAGGAPVVVDQGVSTYEVCPRRSYERSTAAHNTVEIAGQDQSEMWSAFRVGRRARVAGLSVTDTEIAAAHTGYDRLGARHRRTFRFGDGLTILDEVSGKPAPAIARFHLAPAIKPKVVDGAVIAGPVRFAFEGGEPRLAASEMADGFNRTVPAQCIEVEVQGRLSTTIRVAR